MTTNTPSPAQRPQAAGFGSTVWARAAFALCAVSLYLALSLVKMRHYYQDGRFWAEEGRLFVRGIYGLDFPGALLWLFHGHLELVTNLIVYLSSLVAFEHAPLVTTYLSLLAQTLPVMVVIAFRDQLKLSNVSLLAWIVILVGLPQGNEVWANTINLHFHFALLAAIIAALPLQAGWQKQPLRGALLVCGLSGIPANFLAPVFLLLAWKERASERWVQFGILAGTAVLQIGFLLLSESRLGNRTYEFDPVVFLLANFNQSFVFPLVGAGIGRAIGELLAEHVPGGGVLGLVLLACMVAPVAWLMRALWRHGTRSERVLFGSSVLMVVLGFWLALGPERVTFIYRGGGRYWYAPNALLFLCLLVFLSRLKIRFGQLYLVLVVVASLHGTHSDRMNGPPWAQAYRQAVSEGAGRVAIWPAGWYMWIPAPRER